MQEKEFYNQFVERYIENKATEDLEVFAHLLILGKLDNVLDLMMKKQNEESNDRTNNIKEMLLWRRIAVAVSIVLVLGVSGYFLLNPSKSTSNSNKNIANIHETQFKNDIQAPSSGNVNYDTAGQGYTKHFQLLNVYSGSQVYFVNPYSTS